MRILVTNDDGVNARGIQVLCSYLEKSHEVYVIAPEGERSATGHGLTLKGEIRFSHVGANRYSCSGLPADCTQMGMGHLLKDCPPDVVISGINHGANLGVDTYYSGTVAGAREAAIKGIPGIAISTCTDFFGCADDQHFDTAAIFLCKLLDRGVVDLIHEDHYLNINVPNLHSSDLAGVEYADLGKRIYKTDFVESSKGHYKYVSGMVNYLKLEGSDCVSISNRKVSLTPLNIFGTSTDKLLWENFIRTI
ncbi:MAG: 5'/3'-nucleotidase SurE [Bacteriovoracaceae bacterium]|nr:5'/3'-nucleotidase SurE [Bacteriovoracaceae bacterium]